MRAYNETKYIDNMSGRIADEFLAHKKLSSMGLTDDDNYFIARDELVKFARFLLRSKAFVDKRPTLTKIHRYVFNKNNFLTLPTHRTVFIKVARSLGYKNREIADYLSLDPSTVSYHFNIEELYIQEIVIETLNKIKESLILSK